MRRSVVFGILVLGAACAPLSQVERNTLANQVSALYAFCGDYGKQDCKGCVACEAQRTDTCEASNLSHLLALDDLEQGQVLRYSQDLKTVAIRSVSCDACPDDGQCVAARRAVTLADQQNDEIVTALQRENPGWAFLRGMLDRITSLFSSK